MRSQAQNPYLDWIRFLAALVVLLTHTRDTVFLEFSELAPESHNIVVAAFFGMTRLGHEAVIVFFVLSGFLVGGPAFERAANGSFDAKSYTIDRSVRIFVPLLPAIVLTAIAGLLLQNRPEIWNLVGHVFSLQGVVVPVAQHNQPLWSLSYEVWFYVIGGTVGYLWLNNGRRAGRIIALVLLTISVVVFTQLKVVNLAIWVLGAFAYIYRPQKVNRKHIYPGFGMMVVGVVLRQIAKPNTLFEGGLDGIWYGVLIADFLIALGMAFLIANAFSAKTDNGGRVGAIGGYLASFSFSLYLIHRPLLLLSPIRDESTVSISGVFAFAVTALIIMLLAYGYSRIFETTSPRIKRYVHSRLGP